MLIYYINSNIFKLIINYLFLIHFLVYNVTDKSTIILIFFKGNTDFYVFFEDLSF